MHDFGLFETKSALKTGVAASPKLCIVIHNNKNKDSTTGSLMGIHHFIIIKEWLRMYSSRSRLHFSQLLSTQWNLNVVGKEVKRT